MRLFHELLKQSFAIAVFLAVCSLAPRCEGQKRSDSSTKPSTDKTSQPSALLIPNEVNNYWINADTKTGKDQSPSPEWALVIVGIGGPEGYRLSL